MIALKKIVLVTAGNSIGNGAIFSEVFLIQCKNLKVEKKLKRDDAIRLIKLAEQCGATPLLAINRNRKLIITEVT